MGWSLVVMREDWYVRKNMVHTVSCQNVRHYIPKLTATACPKHYGFLCNGLSEDL